MDDIITDVITKESQHFKELRQEVHKVVIGQEEAITFMIIAILCQGHILLEGIPGVAKTTMIKALTKALGLSFKRIQFTPDLLPADLIGTLIYNPKTQEFETKKGPIFANLILADEINRAPAKVQAALLEAMQEGQVTIGSTTYTLDKPFLVFATQNPLEQEGTYPLPEAQVDRFMFKILIGYPSISEEKQLLKTSQNLDYLNTLFNNSEILKAQELVSQIYCDERVTDYMLKLVFATREPEKFNLYNIKKYIAFGVSPRATLALDKASRAHAFLNNRQFVTPDDVKAIVKAVMRHRLILSFEADAEGITTDWIITKIVDTIPTP